MNHSGGWRGGSLLQKHLRFDTSNFRINEHCRYEYDFGDGREHQVRIEARLPLDDKLT